MRPHRVVSQSGWRRATVVVFALTCLSMMVGSRHRCRYMYGQTFGYVPFTYIVSMIQVCNEAPPDSLVAEMEAALLVRNGPATAITASTAAASATVTTTAGP